ncbi:hypothetical protein BJ742DRAFT_859695 [Cladochytrium replicatum]|nr:hypothetical protein BJ742DRAFT_859695 [Cladochytrium replicatum]
MVFPLDILERNAVLNDFRAIANFRKWMTAMDKDASLGRASTFHVLQSLARSSPNGESLVFGSKVFTYSDLDRESNRAARWLLANDVKTGDTISLLLPNCPEFMIWWFGAMKIGAITAFINNSQRSAALIHSLKIAKAKLIIFDATFADAIEEVLPDISDFGALFVNPGASWSLASYSGQIPSFAPVVDVEGALREFEDSDLPEDITRRDTWQQNCALIYTSGTSGLPKAANVTHGRVVLAGYFFVDGFQLRKGDRTYCPLPLFHSSAVFGGMAAMLVAGGTMILVPKFSATRFFEECRQYNASCAQYIGELCRYLLATPPSASDTNHPVRILYGNGLRPDIWNEFVRRFQIKEIGEFYGASEGAVTTSLLYRSPIDRKCRVTGGGPGVGCIGRMGPIAGALLKNKLVKVDPVTGDPVRGKNGFLVECKLGETGELMREVVKNAPVVLFSGYHGNPEASSKKLLTDCFAKGDVYYRSGDLIRRDSLYYMQFIDRVGDTFRWKGENVSTTEVAEVLSKYPGMLEANVYGAAIPGHDGRAGMAAVVVGPDFDISGLAKHCASKLPKYAVPLFIRILPDIPKTSTFKQLKYNLREEGADPQAVKEDPLFILDSFAEGRNVTNKDPGIYRPMSSADYLKIQGGVKARL